MSGPLFRKLLRDLRVPLAVVALLLAAFQCLWAKITDRISNDLMPQLRALAVVSNVSDMEIENTIFSGPGKIMQTMMGGEGISLFRITDMLSIGYVHPLMLTVFCVWAIGRAAGAVAGEIDRGTMELLLAQPLARYRVIVTHLVVDLATFPVLCLSLWLGNWVGIYAFDVREVGNTGLPETLVDPRMFAPGLFNVAALLFAVSGYTMWLSAAGRFRWRVLGLAVLLTLVQFLINVVGQLWSAAAFLRPATVFFYFQPQGIVLKHLWTIDLASVWDLKRPVPVSGIGVLVAVGVIGYAMALWTFCRRDLPAPL